MASMNFPTSPSVGDEYVWEDFTYVWDGIKWTTKVLVSSEEYVKKSGDTMTGDLEVPMVYLQSGQVDAPNATTRKDYVDGNFIKNTGGYITGPLTVDIPNNGIPLVLGVPNPTDKQEIQGWSGNTLKWAVGVPNDNNTSTYLTNHVDGVSIALASYGAISSHPVLTNAAQPIDANSLTRKDYVDNKFLTIFTNSFTGDVFTLTAPGSYNIEAAGTTNWPWSSGGTLLIQKHGSYLTRLAMNASDGSLAVGASIGNAPFTWQEVYSTNNPPVALEAKVAELETRLTQLEATVETQQAQINSLLSRMAVLETTLAAMGG